MVQDSKPKGLIVAVFTPFNENNELNLQEIPKYGKYLADHNVQGVLVNGTVGEGTSLTFEERKAVLESWVKISKTYNLKVFAQIGGTNLKQVKELAQHAELLQVDGIVCLPDLFFKPKSAEDLVLYLKAVGQSATKTPLLYYHTPSFTGVQLDMRRFLEIGSKEIPTLAGIKFNHPILGEALRCLPVNGGKFTIFHGYDQILSAAFTMGINDVMVTSLNYAPTLVHDIHEHIKNGRNSEALKIERRFMALTGFILNMTSWTTGYKAVTSIITGLNLGNSRSPLKPLNEEQLRKLKNELKEKNWLK